MTDTFTLRKILLAVRCGATPENFERHVQFRNVVEFEEGFDADWVCDPIGEAYLEIATIIGVTGMVP